MEKYTKSNTPPWVFFTFFKLYKWYQIAQRITYMSWVIDKSWLMQESPGLKSDWFMLIRLFSKKKRNFLLKMYFSRFFPQIRKIETEQ